MSSGHLSRSPAPGIAKRPFQLPQDVLFMIFQEVGSPPKPFNYALHVESDGWGELEKEHTEMWRRGAAAMSILCLITKDWNATATPLLYRALNLETRRQISIAASTLEYRGRNPAPWLCTPPGIFVKTLYIGTNVEIVKTSDMKSTITDAHTVILHTPNLRSYHTSLEYAGNVGGDYRYGNIIVPLLLQSGKDITTLEISNSWCGANDISKLIHNLLDLHTLIIDTLLLLELGPNKSRFVSDSIRTLILAEPYRADGCSHSDLYNLIATWSLPNLESMVINEACATLCFKDMITFMAAHGETVKRVVIRRWLVGFSPEEVLAASLAFSGFTCEVEGISLRFSRE